MTTTAEIHVFATLVARPGMADDVRAALIELAGATRSEAGNVHYMLHEDPKNLGSFYFFEVYRDRDALVAHKTAPHMAAAFAKIGALLAAAPVITSTRLIAGS